MPNDFNQQIIDEFRANNGRVGGFFAGSRLLLLTTTGARTGRPHTVPLGYLPDRSRLLVIASAGGAPEHPDWYRNILADPQVTVEDGVFTHRAEAVVLAGEERDRIFARAVEADPGWAEYQARTTRVLPVVALTVTGGAPDATTPGDFLVQVHNAFRRELELVRGEIVRSGATVGAQLRITCLTLCEGLRHHHVMEDEHMFPGLRGGRPELAPVLDLLDEEHDVVEQLLDGLERLLAADDTTTADLLAQIDRLAAGLDPHFSREEEHLVPLLDSPAP